MALYIKDPQVDALAQELAVLTRATKTEAVRQALQNEITREKGKRDLVEQSVAFGHRLRERAGSGPGKPANRAFLDRLYGDPR